MQPGQIQTLVCPVCKLSRPMENQPVQSKFKDHVQACFSKYSFTLSKQNKDHTIERCALGHIYDKDLRDTHRLCDYAASCVEIPKSMLMIMQEYIAFPFPLKIPITNLLHIRAHTFTSNNIGYLKDAKFEAFNYQALIIKQLFPDMHDNCCNECHRDNSSYQTCLGCHMNNILIVTTLFQSENLCVNVFNPDVRCKLMSRTVLAKFYRRKPSTNNTQPPEPLPILVNIDLRFLATPEVVKSIQSSEENWEFGPISKDIIDEALNEH